MDGSGSAYVTGYTDSTDFPTQNPFQTDQPDIDVFVTKLSPSGNSLVYSTYLGGNGIGDFGAASPWTARGAPTSRATPVRRTSRPRTPTRRTNPAHDAFVTKLSPSGNSLVYSTYLGGGAD